MPVCALWVSARMGPSGIMLSPTETDTPIESLTCSLWLASVQFVGVILCPFAMATRAASVARKYHDIVGATRQPVQPVMGGPRRRRRMAMYYLSRSDPLTLILTTRCTHHHTIAREMRRCNGGAVVSGRLLGLLGILLMRVGSFGYRSRSPIGWYRALSDIFRRRFLKSSMTFHGSHGCC